MEHADAAAAAEQDLRFGFGANWRSFLDVLTEDRIGEAEASLCGMLGVTSLDGCRFLDVGCGSGLFSLAARRLGATVRSFDFDRDSVACTQELRRRYFPDDERWQVSQGSVLDATYMAALGKFDLVYSWGVLHHTGDMWRAVENAAAAVGNGGRFFIALYNDQGWQSVWWTKIKRTYNQLPRAARLPYLLAISTLLEGAALAASLVSFQPRRVINRWTRYESVRGMSRWHDLVDWIGGFPFEVATPDAVLRFCRQRGFTLLNSRTCGRRMGCNEFVFKKDR